MTAPRRPSEQATVRGAIVVFIAVLVGVALLSRSDGGLFGSSEPGSAGPTTTTESTPSTSTSSTSSTVPTNSGGGTAPAGEQHEAGEVKVIVVNAASGLVGVGTSNTEKVAGAGFATLDVKNAGQDVPSSGLFFAPGYEADAGAVKTALGWGDVPIQAAPNPPIIPEAGEANVVVVIGQDYETISAG